MQYDINLDSLSLTIGISSERLAKNIATYSAMSEVFPMLEVKDCKVGLFGGTALNKIYFGKKQRLSYDLDIFAYSYQRVIEVLKKDGAEIRYSGKFPNKKAISTRMEYKDVILDVVDASEVKEQPQKLLAFDLLYYYNQLVPPVVVPSYSIEYLLAEKTMAMLNRNELRDIYDTWTGIKLLKDAKLYVGNLKKAAKTRNIKDIKVYSDYQIANMLLHVDYYKKKKIEVLNEADALMMLKDIKAFLNINVK